jgi:adenylate kinase
VTDEGKLAGEIKKYMSKGGLVPDRIVIAVLRKRLVRDDCENGFILDGYPRTIAQARALDDFADIDAIIHLRVPNGIIVERLSSRRICKNCGAVYNVRFLKPKKEGLCDKCGGSLYQRGDDTAAVIRDRLKVYARQTQPILEYFEGNVPFIDFRCDRIDIPPQVAVAEILEKLEKLENAGWHP